MSGAGDVFAQKKLRTSLRFEFGENQLSFTHADTSGQLQKNIPYETLDLKTSSTMTVKTRLISRKIYLISILAVFVASATINYKTVGTMGGLDVSLMQALFCLPVAVLLLYLIPAQITYTMINTPQGKIRVIHNTDHDAIMRKLNECWLQRMRQLYAMINFSNDPNREMQKFVWLKENGVIDEGEFNDLCTKLREAVNRPSLGPEANKPTLN